MAKGYTWISFNIRNICGFVYICEGTLAKGRLYQFNVYGFNDFQDCSPILTRVFLLITWAWEHFLFELSLVWKELSLLFIELMILQMKLCSHAPKSLSSIQKAQTPLYVSLIIPLMEGLNKICVHQVLVNIINYSITQCVKLEIYIEVKWIGKT